MSEQAWLRDALNDIRGDIRDLKTDVRGDISDVWRDVKKQNGRIRNLEIWRGKMLGIGAAIALIISIAVKVLT